ncbi:MAG: palmitoyl protein thioesterase 2 [Circular genetic element sp.]|nr:MAG: palmitoyl protein thioesterase 2 [Circular genetic element sp.]
MTSVAVSELTWASVFYGLEYLAKPPVFAGHSLGGPSMGYLDFRKAKSLRAMSTVARLTPTVAAAAATGLAWHSITTPGATPYYGPFGSVYVFPKFGLM